MLESGRDRAIDADILNGIEYLVGDAEHLPVASGSVDAYTIAFGLRNVTHIDAALARGAARAEAGRAVLLPRIQPRRRRRCCARAYDLYSFNVLPMLGQIVAGDRESYRYLVESIRRFPPQAELADHDARRRARAGALARFHLRRRRAAFRLAAVVSRA